MLWLHQVGLARDLRVWAQASPPGGVWQILHRPHSLVIQEEAPTHCLSQALAGARKGPPLLCGKPCSMRTGPAGSPAPRAPCCRPLAGGFLPVTQSHSSHRFCFWRATRSYLQHRGKTFKDRKTPPKSPYQYPSWSGGKLHVTHSPVL